MGKNTIILCIDIDETLMNSKTTPRSLVDFNGSDEYDDSSAWTHFIREMRHYCELHSFELLVQIISGKQNALPDDTVDLVVLHLIEFLQVLDKNGHAVSFLSNPSHYMVRRYVENHRQLDILCDLDSLDTNPIQANTKSLLPPIHLCFNNKPGHPTLSKAWVMKSIKEHFNHWIPAKNMFLIDNNVGNLKEVSTGSDGATPCFQAVSAACLEENTGSSLQDKKFRTRQCFNVLKNCKQLIIRRIQEVLCEEAAESKRTQPAVNTPPPVLPPPPSRFRHGLSFQEIAIDAIQTTAKLKSTEEVAETLEEGNSNNSVP